MRSFLDDSPEQETEVLDALHAWTLDHGARVFDRSWIPTAANRDAELWSPLLKIIADANDKELYSSMVSTTQNGCRKGHRRKRPPTEIRAPHRAEATARKR